MMSDYVIYDDDDDESADDLCACIRVMHLRGRLAFI